ncbi:hypothetical protein [Halostagnicola kamekurae]|uniref:Uncharacterized protein n=1 Tax=Halostagnicola kamekurae TaxID=619731 RepID=A0A1I6V8S7_9EURY|nr:hypothetical protein [Halostagnicola kamekurae]SFT10148.1 hypothetical protein SAMN04488556_0138 [Halostagnicola kamekurae]
MTGDRDDVDGDGVPDSDPRHIDPAGDLADVVESGDLEIELDDDQDADELREFIERAEAGEFDADPGLEATVRIVRAMLEDDSGEID